MKTYYHNILETFYSFDRRNMKVYEDYESALREFYRFVKVALRVDGDSVTMLQTTMIGKDIVSVDEVKKFTRIERR